MMAFSGHRILFVDVWINFVQSDIEALSRHAFGDRSYKKEIYVVSTSLCVHAPVVRRLIMYGRLGRIWHVSRTGLQFAKLHARR